MIAPFGRKNSIVVIGGMLLYHIIVFALCVFFICKFLIYDYDPTVFLLLVMLCGSAIFLDVLFCKYRIWGRFLAQYKVNPTGILYTCFGNKRIFLWSEICVYGVIGYSSLVKEGMVFFSIDPHENVSHILGDWMPEKRIIFQVKNSWDKIKQHIPDKIKGDLDKTILAKEDRFFRCRKDMQ